MNGPKYDQIILTSIEVFSRTNYETATTALLSKEAGIAEGTLYKYFPGKKELFLACCRHIEGMLIERYREIYEETKDKPVEFLKRVANSYLDFVTENPNRRKFLAFVLNNTFDDDFRAELEQFLKQNVGATERMIKLGIQKGEIRDDIDPTAAAWMFVGGYFTLILIAEIGAPEVLGPKYMDSLFKGFIKAE
ncbi:MAG TPA: TetR/AcrR family transcriptional regulator [Candidatus Anoxymicrobiaceae bacterium]